MRAVQLTGPAPDATTTRVVTTDEPRPGPGELAIEVAYAGINFMDVMARRGDAGYASGWPYTPGLEVAGRVRALGAGVDRFAVGDRVAALTRAGGLAEVALASADVVTAVPAAVPLPVAAAAPLVLSTATLLLRDAARLRPGDSVLMHSASGGVGHAVARLAAAEGAGPRLGTVGRPDKIADGLAAGWDVVTARGEDVVAAVRAAAPGGVDVILDPTGTANLELDLELAAPGARIVLFGNATGGTPTPLPPLARLIGGNVALIGFSISRLRDTVPHRVAAALADGLDKVGDGGLELPVTVVDSLDRVAEIHDLLAAGRGSGKYVVAIGGE
ncbi:zinc-binding alcohol dehydrogenase family protein [Nocardia sp. NPDC059691]|uniref:quinone oxidoreductase family protein n=1 Tax=Nocardia sp. NPDC059691 TaxID=3346908 RepID=UPI0036B745FE